jgi:hypothetical protein
MATPIETFTSVVNQMNEGNVAAYGNSLAENYKNHNPGPGSDGGRESALAEIQAW